MAVDETVYEGTISHTIEDTINEVSTEMYEDGSATFDEVVQIIVDLNLEVIP